MEGDLSFPPAILLLVDEAGKPEEREFVRARQLATVQSVFEDFVEVS